MMKRKNRNSGSDSNGILPSLYRRIRSGDDGDNGDAPNILDNRVETIREPLTDLKHISQEYRGRVTFIKQPAGEKGIVEILQDVCPTKAFDIEEKKKRPDAFGIDHGKCIMCGICSSASPDFIKVENLFVRSAGKRSQLVESAAGTADSSNVRSSLDAGGSTISNNNDNNYSALTEEIGKELQTKIRSLFGRSLAIRTVNAASCNGCEIEINALLNPIYDIERFGIHFVSSPRHADVLLVTGPVSSNMEEPLRLTYDAIPGPKAVIAVGACGCSGGIFAGSYSVIGGVDKIIPVDVYIPGCPPRPQALLEGILLAIDKLAASLKDSHSS
ncbi:MAG TPA: NADH-quinone oxidoreductase subunit NuoB [Nitrososphaera sp.]